MDFINTIFNESCLETVNHINNVDVVLTSPFYNTAGSTILDGRKSKANQYARYDTKVDTMTDEEYCQFTIDLFNGLDKVLKDDGVVLYNISYSTNNSNGFLLAVSDIIRHTNFSMVDMISWKKENCIPNVSSPNRLTRIVEPVFVFCKKGHEKTFYANKPIMPQKDSPHIVYKSINNIIEAKTSDGKCPYNKATYSTDLCKKLLSIYAPSNGLIYDPFMGSGTTAVACVEMGLKYVGSEISSNQVNYANERISKHTLDESLFE